MRKFGRLLGENHGGERLQLLDLQYLLKPSHWLKDQVVPYLRPPSLHPFSFAMLR